MNIVGIITCKNDEKVIGKSLQRLSEICDGVLVYDDGSTDNSVSIIKKTRNIIELKENPPYKPFNRKLFESWSEEKVNEIKPEWIIYIDSDDVIDVRFKDHKDEYFNEKYDRICLKEITLWGSKDYYRVDNPEKFSRYERSPYIIRYNGNFKWHSSFFNDKISSRLIKFGRQNILSKYVREFVGYNEIQGTGIMGKLRNRILFPDDQSDILHATIVYPTDKIAYTDFVKIHYHFFDLEFAVRKHITYALVTGLYHNRSKGEIQYLAKRYASWFNEDGLKLEKVKPEWGVI